MSRAILKAESRILELYRPAIGFVRKTNYECGTYFAAPKEMHNLSRTTGRENQPPRSMISKSQNLMEEASFGLKDQESTISNLQTQIEEVLAQLVKTTDRIRKIASENETLRQENANLRRHFV